MGQYWTPITPLSGSLLHADLQTLAIKHHKSTEEVAKIYSKVLADFQRPTYIKIYLPILVSKKVKEFITA